MLRADTKFFFPTPSIYRFPSLSLLFSTEFLSCEKPMSVIIILMQGKKNLILWGNRIGVNLDNSSDQIGEIGEIGKNCQNRSTRWLIESHRGCSRGASLRRCNTSVSASPAL